MSKIVTIHQPDFMPWMGLFNKINKADEFIILDHVVNNPRSPEFWCRRVKMLIGGKDHWMSITLKKDPKQLFIPIHVMEIAIEQKALKKFLQTIELNYKKAPYFNETFGLIEEYFKLPTPLMSERNSWFIKQVMFKCNIETNVFFSSSMSPEFTSNEMLIDLIKKRQANIYLCGGGAGGYQKDELYQAEGISVEYNNFIHPTYYQFNSASFIKGLSIVDALMNLGFEKTAKLIKNE